MPNAVEAAPNVANLLLDYPELIAEAMAAHVPNRMPIKEPERFSPGFFLPDFDGRFRQFASVATASWQQISIYGGCNISLLDLADNPGTNTTKTFPSLLIVARAIEYIRRTGEPIMILTPTSANKGVGLRDAVLRAIDAGLVTPEELRVAVLAPLSSRYKLRASRLTTDTTLRGLNPTLLYTGTRTDEVKQLGRAFVDQHASTMRYHRNLNVWYSLDLNNYLVADTARAFVENALAPTDTAPRKRWHVHAVSSAFGLLGYHAGREILEAAGRASVKTRPRTLLVQHLGTPDMVLHLLYGTFDRDQLPTYHFDEETGLFHQEGNHPNFPEVTYDPVEVLDPTFYTRCPATSPMMDTIIRRHGGGGIVVSLAECVARYPLLRSWLAATRRSLPGDLRSVREWSMVMALTGATIAIDRGLVAPDHDLVVHGSGSYTATDFEQMDLSHSHLVSTVEEVAEILLG